MTFNLNFQTLSAYHATRELVPGMDTAKLAGNVIALPTPAFWKAWNADAEKLSAAGYTVAHYRSNFCVLVPIGGTLEAPAPVKISTPIEVTTARGIRYACQRIDAENLHPLTACFLVFVCPHVYSDEDTAADEIYHEQIHYPPPLPLKPLPIRD